MERAEYLKGQAVLLRGIAGTFDIPSIRDRLLALANECQILARLVGEAPPKKQEPRRSHSSAPAADSRRKPSAKPR